MARYVQLTPCQNCGSSDANAEYSDGSSYCFSCRKYTPPSFRLKQQIVEEVRGEKSLTLSPTLPLVAKQWLRKYGLTEQETSAYGWNDYYDLCYPLPDGGWVCRGFGKGWKYRVIGKRTFPIFFNSSSQTIVFTEDIVSAIKVSRHSTAIPLLGCSVQTEHLTLANKYGKVFKLWLDPNKRKEAIQQCLRLRSLGVNITPIFSEADPKELSDKEIKEKL